MAGLAQDLRYALRLLRKSPTFSLTVMLLLSLGIGLNSAIFSLLDAVLLRPLPVRHPEQLVRLVQIRPVIGARSSYPLEVVQALQQYSQSFSDVFAFEDRNGAVRDASGASRVRCQIVTGNFFTALGVRPLYGRLLGPEDETPSAGAPPVVLSYAYWRRAFDGHPDIVGRTIALQDHAFTVVGITPKGFNGITLETTPDVRVTRAAENLLADEEDGGVILGYDYSIAARLKAGVTLQRARAECAGIVAAATGEASRRLREHSDWDSTTFDLQSVARGVSLLRPKFSSALILLMAGVGLLLLMICANVAGLLLARSSARRREAAVRLAVGATTARLVRQWLTESLLLALLGGLAGIVVAFAATPLLARALPPVRDFDATALTLSLDLRPDWRVLLFSLTLCLLAALAAGLPAALQAAREDLHTTLKAARGVARQPLRWGLAAVQVALCTLLLAGAGLLISTFHHLRAVDPGFDEEHLVTFSLDPTMLRYDGREAESLQSRLIAEARRLPGVRSAAVAMRGLMLGTGLKASIALEGRRVEAADFLNSSLNAVSPEYFDTLGMRILEGRGFRDGEPAVKPARVIVNRAFARRFFPQADPIGRRFGNGPIGAIVQGTSEIIGVVSDAKYRSIREPIPPTVYSYWSKDFSQSFFLEVRTANRPESVIEPMRKALYAIDPRLPFYEIRTMAEEVDTSLWPDRVLAWLSAVFSILAVALTALGMYGTVAYRIAESRREIGVRVALGAGTGHILRQFTARPMFLTASGLFAGLTIFLAVTPAFGGVLYGVSPADPLALALASITTFAATLAAAGIGAAAALKVDPAALLRHE